VTEVFVQFRDYLITYAGIQTGTVAYARVAGWLMRYPHARVEERMGKVCAIKISIDENVPPELRYDG
jgi:hypothetical protein